MRLLCGPCALTHRCLALRFVFQCIPVAPCFQMKNIAMLLMLNVTYDRIACIQKITLIVSVHMRVCVCVSVLEPFTLHNALG